MLILVLLIKKTSSAEYELPAGDSMLNVGDHVVLIEKAGNRKVLAKFSGHN